MGYLSSDTICCQKMSELGQIKKVHEGLNPDISVPIYIDVTYVEADINEMFSIIHLTCTLIPTGI